MIIDYNTLDNPPPTGGGDHSEGSDSSADSNSGTLILDGTCAPQNISYPQDVNLLNEAREDLEKMIDIICYEQNYLKPRMYRQNARKDYLNLAKRKYGLGLLTTKLDVTTRSSIALSIIAMNVSRLTVVSFVQICISVFSRYKQCFALKKYMQNKPYELLEVC